MKKFLTALLLAASLLVPGCAGRTLGPTEGNLRADIAVEQKFVHVGDPWQLRINLRGRQEVVFDQMYVMHIYLLDWEEEGVFSLGHFNAREVTLTMGPLSEYVYHYIKGDPRIHAGDNFFQPEPVQPNTVPPIDQEAVFDGRVKVTFVLYEFLGTAPNGAPLMGKVVAKDQTYIMLQCMHCQI